MMPDRSQLNIRRLCITKTGKRVYDQNFHLGVNIIRGDNGTGKSTIMDFIFYALGGHLNLWTREAEGCDRVYCEISINANILTLKREIGGDNQAHVYVYDGAFDKSVSDDEHWLKYPQRRNESQISYSQLLFDYLHYPNHKTDDFHNITIHQILRLIYTDQITSTGKILREEPQFDTKNIRKAVGELLLGLDDLNSHHLRQDHIARTKELEQLNGQINAIVGFLRNSDEGIDRNKIQKTIEGYENEKRELTNKINNISSEKDTTISAGTRDIMQESRKQIIGLQSQIESQNRLSNDLLIEIQDTELFVRSLENRVKAILESRATYLSLGEITFVYCPVCLVRLNESDHNICNLCKSPKNELGTSLAHIQMRNELEFQIKESKGIINDKSADRLAINTLLPALESQLQRLKETYRSQINSTNEVDSLVSAYSERVGYLTKAIESENEKGKHLALLDEYKGGKMHLMKIILDIEEELNSIKAINENRIEFVKDNLGAKTISILKRDLHFEPAFENGETFYFDFAEDKMFLNGQAKFSASSMVILKNSFKLSLLLESAIDRLMRYPRLLLLDNVEDKGMQVSRSQNFQKIIVEECAKHGDKIQVIFTTSMINPDFNDSPLCIGPYYSKGTHTLDFLS